MIKLEVEDYCQNCPCFNANVIRRNNVVYEDPENGQVVLSTDTVIRCHYLDHCRKDHTEINNEEI